MRDANVRGTYLNICIMKKAPNLSVLFAALKPVAELYSNSVRRVKESGRERMLSLRKRG